ncbi:XRE family transcriptional regulator [Clostridium sp. 3-3]|nr:XRE family transcriptional regulator [Clostridium sp. 3-3]
MNNMTYTNTKAVFVAIRQIMLAKDIKIKDLAKRLCKSQSAVSSLFAQSNISLDTLDEICQAIDCQLDINIVPKDKL